MGDAKTLSISGVLVALVVVVALLAKGGSGARLTAIPNPSGAAAQHRYGAIVIQRERFSSGLGRKSISVVFDTLTETSRSGRYERTLSSTTGAPGGGQEVTAGNAIENYDAADNTIYITTFRALVAAEQRQAQQDAPKGSTSSSSVDIQYAYGLPTTPGWTSEYLQDLWDQTYTVAGRTTVGRRAALELIPTPAARNDGSGFESFPTVYVSPETYDPIRSVTSFPSTSGVSTQPVSVADWLEYKVIPATPANQRLLSLTALHPTAKISHSAIAYVRATEKTISRGYGSP